MALESASHDPSPESCHPQFEGWVAQIVRITLNLMKLMLQKASFSTKTLTLWRFD
jgi:hypothetical protein